MDPYSDIRSVHSSEITKDFPFYHHISALELKNIFEEKGWNWGEYKKFTVVRNPYDRVVSLWYHYQWMIKEGHRKHPINSFEEYVNQIDVKQKVPTSLQNFICDQEGNELIIDILKYEELWDLIPTYLADLGVNIDADIIPKLQASEGRNDYQSYYTNTLKQKIYELYTYEINRFSYAFSNIDMNEEEGMNKIDNNENLLGEEGGAWNEDTHMTLHPTNFNFGLSNFIIKKIKPKNMLEFGSGLGFLSRHIVDHSSIEEVYCIEPNDIKGHYREDSFPKLFPISIFNDPHPLEIQKTFDLVISIEVAEHIERNKHEELFDFFISHTNNWIVFSGAHVGQGGHGHISERPEEEWKEEFTKRGMIFQEDLTKQIREACDKKNINHRKNLMVFKKHEVSLIKKMITKIFS